MLYVGGYPTIPGEKYIPGVSLGITSDGFIGLDEEQPKRVAVGLISGARRRVQRPRFRYSLDHFTFDPTLQQSSKVVKVEGEKGKTFTVTSDSGKNTEIDCVLWAIGRHAAIQGMGLEKHGVDKYQNSSAKGIVAIGDVQGKALLPVAIAAGRRLANRFFGHKKFKDDKLM
ncbi:hypothetical protein GG344DRAFT_82655 [Lentinula edodes]|nr:hypothetical protein GG344DRAFT_82655 [Lentinula edodes]